VTNKVDSARWTGLADDGVSGDVRDAQKPVNQPQKLEPVSYRERAINWGNLFFMIPIGVAIAVTADTGPIDWLLLALAVAVTFVTLSLLLQFWRSRPSRKPTITLNSEGLCMPYQFKEPIPWSKIGRIEPSYGNWIRWTSVFIDQEHEVVQLAPWPLSLLPERKRELSMPMVIISSWNMAVDMDELIAELSRFRDNYCGA